MHYIRSKSAPTLYIIAGPNGAGKTTASRRVLPDLQCRAFLNADEIAARLCPADPMQVAVTAGRMMLNDIQAHIERGESFAIETTLATRSYARLVDNARARGYRVVLLFFWLDSPAMASRRVAQRVREGGHNVPAETIERRYWLGLDNLFRLFMGAVDQWVVYDNNAETRFIASSDGKADYRAYSDILRRIPVDHQIRFLGIANCDEARINWEMITAALEQNYEDLLREKAAKEQPVVVSRKGVPTLISAKEALSYFWERLKNPKSIKW